VPMGPERSEAARRAGSARSQVRAACGGEDRRIEYPAAVRADCPALKLQPVAVDRMLSNPPADERRRRRRERKTHQRAKNIGRSYEISDLVPRFFASGEVAGWAFIKRIYRPGFR